MMHKDLWERYSRQMLFAPIGQEGQERLLNSRVAVIGLGALGTVIANNLARAGVGYLKLVDRDYVEDSNLQRQILFDEEDVKENLPKSIAAVNKLKKINSQVTYEGLVDDVNFTNIFSIVDNVDLVVDGTDNFETRYLINEASVSKNVPWIYGACVASYGVAFTIRPGETACLECLWGEGFPPGGGATCDTVGILGPVPSITASLQSIEAIKYLTRNNAALNRKVLYFDLWENSLLQLEVEKREDCQVCGKREFKFITGKKRMHSNFLCGREAFQILPLSQQHLSFAILKKKLQPLGEVSESPYLLKFKTGPYELIVFPDGRALVKGASEEKMARSLYTRYIGS